MPQNSNGSSSVGGGGTVTQFPYQPGSPSGVGAGGSGGGTVEVTWKEYTDAQDEKTRAQNDARFAEVVAKLDTLPGFAGLIGVATTAFVAALAIWAWGASQFGIGVDIQGAVGAELRETQNLTAENSEAIKSLIRVNESQAVSLDAILKAIEGQAQND